MGTRTPFEDRGDGSIDYYQTQPFWSGHLAIDIVGRDGQAAHAIQSGHVWQASWDGGGWAIGGGYSVIITHGPIDRPTMKTSYCHGKGLFVSPGQPVLVGQRVIACDNMGNSTGSHCHHTVELWDGAKWVPVDPHRVYRHHSWQNGSQGPGNLVGDHRIETSVEVTAHHAYLRERPTSTSQAKRLLRRGTKTVLEAVAQGQAAGGTGSTRTWFKVAWWSGQRWVHGWLYGGLTARV